MACERWCSERGDYEATGSSSPSQWLYVLLFLVVLLCCGSSSLAIGQFDHEYYSYSGIMSNARSSVEYSLPYLSFAPEEELLVRERRMTNDKDTINSDREPQGEQAGDKIHQQQQQQQQQQSIQQQQQGLEQTSINHQIIQQPSTLQQNLKQQQEQQQQQQQQQQKPVNATSNSQSDDVSYSTISGASENHDAASSTKPSVEVSTQKSEVTSKRNSVLVSQPMNPQPTMSGDTAEEQELNESASGGYVTETVNNQSKKSEVSEPTTEKDNGNEKEQSDTDIGGISITKFSDMNAFNKSLAQNNITKTEMDAHQYYNSTFIVNESVAKGYWVDMDNHPDLRVNHLLSKSHRRATTVKLKFDFPFYGHKVRNITIATGGFLYTGEYVHSWLAATQYIAPLMANFDTRLSNESFVKYADNGTSFTVEWEKVHLQEKHADSSFTFQVTLHQNGDIVFVYSVIPFIIEQIEDTTHPVKVGLSDAYIMDRTVFFVRRKTIYEYHRVNFNRQDIKNWTVIYLRALPTCLEMDNCTDCLTKLTEFDCKWCSELNQCSTGTFRSRQDWLLKGCDIRHIKEVDICPPSTTIYKEQEEGHDHNGHVHTEEDAILSKSVVKKKSPGSSPLEHPRENMNMSVSGIIGILLVVTLIAGLGGWVAYAYRNPHSASGQMLIRYRPSQWSWRRGEARYTAATIHM
ncbi:plexin domain-containing protein 2 isoform X2 [Vespa velutina]|uniref:plexin domain-containing protein 2 isoform X2 n=1 Tax=Vespa velutina TaxID=202808 RepID=UPI001FB4C7E7|nr:plexin domain-containing protein 2 isoform X2 [Vespa velutina]